MTLLSRMTLFQLSKRLQQIDDDIEKAVPDLVAERNLVKQLMEARSSAESTVYANVSGPTEAVELCLNLAEEEKLTKKEIIRRILNGGYLTDKPRAANGVLNDTLNTMIRRGKLVLKGEIVTVPPKKK